MNPAVNDKIYVSPTGVIVARVWGTFINPISLPKFSARTLSAKYTYKLLILYSADQKFKDTLYFLGTVNNPE